MRPLYGQQENSEEILLTFKPQSEDAAGIRLHRFIGTGVVGSKRRKVT